MAQKSKKVVLPEGYGYARLRPLVSAALDAQLSVLVRGHPGLGKSTLARQLAAERGLPLIDIRLAQRDPVDLAGVYFPDRERRELVAYPPDWARRAEAEPCFVFLDEINAAVTRLHQAAAYQIVLERRVGEVRFHPGTVVMAAGNLEEDAAIVSSLSSALCNRFVHFVLDLDIDGWIDWGISQQIHPDILSYIAATREESLYKNTGDVAFPTPRSWEMASRLLASAEPDDAKHLVAACVGRAAADHFDTHRRVHLFAAAEKIVKKGMPRDYTAPESNDPSVIYAEVFAVANWIYRQELVADEHLPNVVKFLRSPGLDAEYAFLFLRYLKSHDRGAWKRLRAVESFRELAGELVGLRRAALA